jgi:hypothetical protein
MTGQRKKVGRQRKLYTNWIKSNALMQGIDASTMLIQTFKMGKLNGDSE